MIKESKSKVHGLRVAARQRASLPPPPPARRVLPAALVLLLALSAAAGASAPQGGGHILFGDLHVDESKVEGMKPLSFDLILYSAAGNVLGRQTVPNNGRYRFLNLRNGEYDVAVEVENHEVARTRVHISSPFKNDFRQDIHLEWRDGGGGRPARPQTVSVADLYKRTSANKSLFEKAQDAIDKKKYEQALSLLKQLLTADPKDFQAWTELGTLHLLQGDAAEAEQSYRRALSERPAFSLALLNLGRVLLSQKKYEEAVEPLARAVQAQPTSADANRLLGEAYLQIKKGSKAVPYLNEAARLGRADAHLRLAALYKAAGLKDRAAAEYELFLTKEPNHPDREKLRRYIEENRKQ